MVCLRCPLESSGFSHFKNVQYTIKSNVPLDNLQDLETNNYNIAQILIFNFGKCLFRTCQIFIHAKGAYNSNWTTVNQCEQFLKYCRFPLIYKIVDKFHVNSFIDQK
jgi:hypothetical protein